MFSDSGPWLVCLFGEWSGSGELTSRCARWNRNVLELQERPKHLKKDGYSRTAHSKTSLGIKDTNLLASLWLCQNCHFCAFFFLLVLEGLLEQMTNNNSSDLYKKLQCVQAVRCISAQLNTSRGAAVIHSFSEELDKHNVLSWLRVSRMLDWSFLHSSVRNCTLLSKCSFISE